MSSERIEARIAQKLLRDRGYRVTPQRVMILSALLRSDDHISAEEIHSQIGAEYPQVNISTVYRTLKSLKRLGLVSETDLGQGRTEYHYAEKAHHHHLVCQKCGAIVDLDESLLTPLNNALLRQYGFRADLTHFAIFGSCAKCED